MDVLIWVKLHLLFNGLQWIGDLDESVDESDCLSSKKVKSKKGDQLLVKRVNDSSSRLVEVYQFFRSKVV